MQSQGRTLTKWRSSASGIDGLSEGEVEVMHLREENEALMDSLVRTKVDLAETEGTEYKLTFACIARTLNFAIGSIEEVKA